NGLAPRLGLAFDLTGDQRTVLRASYGRYYEGLLGSYYWRALPRGAGYVVYDNTRPPLVEIHRVPAPPHPLDPRGPPPPPAAGIRHPRMDGVTLGFERAPRADLRLAVTGVWRETANMVDSVREASRWQAVGIENQLTGEPITVYRLTNPESLDLAPLITNVDG